MAPRPDETVARRSPALLAFFDRYFTRFFGAHMRALRVPTLVMTGDEDWPCLEPGLLMKRSIPSAALVVMPNAGHAINLEWPSLFNRHLTDFFQIVDAGRWPMRDPRAVTGAILGR